MGEIVCGYDTPLLGHLRPDSQIGEIGRWLDKDMGPAHLPHKTATLGSPYSEVVLWHCMPPFYDYPEWIARYPDITSEQCATHSVKKELSGPPNLTFRLFSIIHTRLKGRFMEDSARYARFAKVFQGAISNNHINKNKGCVSLDFVRFDRRIL